MFPIRDHNPSGQVPFVTYALILVNVAVFLLLNLRLDERSLAYAFYEWGFVPLFISEGLGFAGIVTHMFLHGGWMHLIGNMLFLFIFGDNIEKEWGHWHYGLFYFASGLAAVALQYAMAPLSEVPMVGASGAIAGVMGSYLVLFPRAKVDVLFIFVIFFRIFAIPAWIVLGVWIGLQIFSGATVPGDDGGVAYFAHIGGFVAGMAMTAVLWLRRGGPAYWARTKGVPPHAATLYKPQPMPFARSRIPKVPRR